MEIRWKLPGEVAATHEPIQAFQWLRSERKGRTEKLVKVMQLGHHEVVTYLKNCKQLILMVNKKFKIFDF